MAKMSHLFSTPNLRMVEFCWKFSSYKTKKILRLKRLTRKSSALGLKFVEIQKLQLIALAYELARTMVLKQLISKPFQALLN